MNRPGSAGEIFDLDFFWGRFRYPVRLDLVEIFETLHCGFA